MSAWYMEKAYYKNIKFKACIKYIHNYVSKIIFMFLKMYVLWHVIFFFFLPKCV